MRSGARCNRFQMKGPPMQKPSTMNFADAQVIHQAELVVGVGVPGPVDLERAGGLAAVGVAQVGRDAAILVLELLHRVERRALVCQAIVEFNPPPGMSSNGKPEPTSS